MSIEKVKAFSISFVLMLLCGGAGAEDYIYQQKPICYDKDIPVPCPEFSQTLPAGTPNTKLPAGVSIDPCPDGEWEDDDGTYLISKMKVSKPKKGEDFCYQELPNVRLVVDCVRRIEIPVEVCSSNGLIRVPR